MQDDAQGASFHVLRSESISKETLIKSQIFE